MQSYEMIGNKVITTSTLLFFIYEILSSTNIMAEIAAYKIKDVQLICEWKLTNRRWLFLLLREHPMIARHRFHEGNLALHLAIQNKCTF